ncbi:MAG: tautomerase family protein [Ignavibacteriaceae bacterium]|nr:tautomerase family protein [Ignavibacteriaceae bacterium]
MPFVTITLREGKDKKFIKTLSETIHSAMLETIVFPEDVLFHKIHEVKKDNMIYLDQFRNVKRSEDMIFIECTIKAGRTPEKKQAMYKRISEALFSELGIRKEDIIIVIRENSAEDWYLQPN